MLFALAMSLLPLLFSLFPIAGSLQIQPRHRFNSAWQLKAATSATSPASDVATTRADAVGAWIPIASASALHDICPQPITVMGLDLVVWHDAAQNDWSVLSDVCPHRLAPLSQGRVDPETNCIECPYHGWQFDTDGILMALPQLETDRNVSSVPGGHATSFPTSLAGDLLFAFLPSSLHGECFPQSLLPIDLYPGLQDEVSTDATYFMRELPYSFDFVVENFMDVGHVPFAHHSLQSVRGDAGPIPMDTVVSNHSHIEVSFQDVSGGRERDGIASFQRPSRYHFRTKRSNGQVKTNLVIYVVPVRAGRSRVLLTTPFKIKFLPTWLLHAASNRFLNTDTWLHDAEFVARSRSANNLNYVYASESDGGVKAFRLWWKTSGFRDAPPNTFGAASLGQLARLSRPEQIQPWECHSKQCSSCRQGLKVIKRIQAGGLVTSLGSAIFLRNHPIPALAVAALALATNYIARRSATVIEGNPYPSGIADRSASHMK